MRRLCLTASLILLLTPNLLASSQWTLTDAQFHSQPITIDSIDSAGIHTAGQLFPWTSTLEISQASPLPAAISGRLSLIFRGGTKLTGSPVSFNGDTLQWKNPALGPVAFSADSLQGITQSNYVANDLDQPRTDDVIHLANGDTMHGTINSIADMGVTIQVGDASPTLTWDAISAVLFSTPQGSSKPAPRMFRLHLAGDEAVDAGDVSVTGNHLSITFPDKTTQTVDVNLIQAIEQINGPIEWLTSLRPLQNIYRPFFSENFPTRFDRTVAGDIPITEKYPAFHHGIGCHSYSSLTYSTAGGWTTFRTQYAIDSDSPLADVTVRIYLDDKPVYQQKNVKAGALAAPIFLPLAGAATVTLEVDYGENYAAEDRFVWLDPALVRAQAAPTTQP